LETPNNPLLRYLQIQSSQKRPLIDYMVLLVLNDWNHQSCSPDHLPISRVFLTFAGLRKLFTEWEVAEATYRNNGFSTAAYYNIAILEVVGSLGLFFPRTRFGGVVILISMIAFIEIRSKRSAPKAPLYLRIPARITQLLLVLLAWELRPKYGG
jgi:hypothetical protein